MFKRVKNTIYFALFIVMLSFSACKKEVKITKTEKKPSANLVIDGKIWSSAFQQKAAEYKVLCFQAYNIAKLRLDEARKEKSNKPLAVVTDIDETILDNSPNAVHQAFLGKGYETESWKEWTAMAKADTLAGSYNFFSYAASKGVTVFYVSNRSADEIKGTLKNLKTFNFPFADSTHILLKTDTSNKEPRRQQVLKKYHIALYLGDNLGDFSDVFDKKSTEDRNKSTAAIASKFGKKFIILPNFNYGGWENALLNNSYKWTPQQKDSIIKSKLKSY